MKIPLFSRFQTYHTFHLPALTFSLQVFRFRQQDTNSRTFQFGQRISARLSTSSSSCSTHTVKYTCNSQLTMSIIRMLLLFTKLLQLGLKALTQLSLQPVSLEQEELADSFASVDWIAYQGAPTGGISGEELFPTWWTGAICQTVTIPSVSILSNFFYSGCFFYSIDLRISFGRQRSPTLPYH